ncbi:MAG TPA: HAMP domain-containing protein [Desulfobacteraceae bacterium]|nr:HAMP domain protein [bacterium BMS3Abin13]HDK43737.1 HAMP domain-containing protein [Desulfobacteraceae bacterium]HDL98625.1 HAMP domain-containing protein [Desulfobacteraceae bacterium]HDO31026.1 HAMP domain-containing protein [Desulfobacteraceae bacterium]
MLVICEDCAKKYNIDESRIQGARARFICKECGHIVIINKPEGARPRAPSSKTASGSSIIDLVKEMQGAARPHVREEKPKPSAPMPPQQIQEEQKPPPEPKWEPLPITGEKEGGLPIRMHFIFALLYTIISTIGVLGYLYFANVLNRQPDLRIDVIITSLSLVGVVAVVGIVIFFFLSRLIAKPLDELTAAANRINDGGLDFPVVSRGPREARQLAAALERVRLSSRRK